MGLPCHRFGKQRLSGTRRTYQQGSFGKLGSDSGIGASLALARININTDKVFAWTLVSIVLIFLIERFVIEPMKKSAFKWQKKAMENI